MTPYYTKSASNIMRTEHTKGNNYRGWILAGIGAVLLLGIVKNCIIKKKGNTDEVSDNGKNVVKKKGE